jgi:hypothetical protein
MPDAAFRARRTGRWRDLLLTETSSGHAAGESSGARSEEAIVKIANRLDARHPGHGPRGTFVPTRSWLRRGSQ